MSKLKVHYAVAGPRLAADPPECGWYPACGAMTNMHISPEHVTRDGNKVTCKRCLKHADYCADNLELELLLMARVEEDEAELEGRKVLHFDGMPYVIAIDPRSSCLSIYQGHSTDSTERVQVMGRELLVELRGAIDKLLETA